MIIRMLYNYYMKHKFIIINILLIPQTLITVSDITTLDNSTIAFFEINIDLPSRPNNNVNYSSSLSM